MQFILLISSFQSFLCSLHSLTHSTFLEMQNLNEMQAHHQFFTILLYTLLNLYFYESSYPPRIPRFFFDTLNSWVIKPTLAMENVLTQLLMHTQHTLMVPGILHSENCKIVKQNMHFKQRLHFIVFTQMPPEHVCVRDAHSTLLAYFRETHIFWWNINMMMVTQKFICIYHSHSLSLFPFSSKY